MGAVSGSCGAGVLRERRGYAVASCIARASLSILPGTGLIHACSAPGCALQGEDRSMAGTIVITCPDCEKQTKVPDNLAGKKVRCKNCGGVIPVPQKRSV